MEAVMGVDDSERERTIRTGEQGMQMSGPRVLVAGASIAGPALAHWLSRWGAKVTVVERASELRPGGQAVDARGVAKEVITRMGLDAAVRAACTDTAGAHTVDADGQVLETFRADDDGGDGFIADIEILRGDLPQVLYDDTRDGVEYIFGDRIAELAQDAGGVDVVFAGGDRRRFDLVVGADGLHSELRARPSSHPPRAGRRRQGLLIHEDPLLPAQARNQGGHPGTDRPDQRPHQAR